MQRTRFLSLLFPLYVLLTACSTTGSAIPDMAAGFPEPDSTTIVQSGDLRIAPLDMLQVSVFGIDELTGDFQVDYVGEIKLPLIGVVEAKGDLKE